MSPFKFLKVPLLSLSMHRHRHGDFLAQNFTRTRLSLLCLVNLFDEVLYCKIYREIFYCLLTEINYEEIQYTSEIMYPMHELFNLIFFNLY